MNSLSKKYQEPPIDRTQEQIVCDVSERIVDEIPIAIAQMDPDGRLLDVNAEAAKIMRCSSEDVVGKSFYHSEWVMTDHNGKALPEEKWVYRHVADTGSCIKDCRQNIQFSDGTHKALSLSGAPIYDEKGELERFVFAFQDITENERLRADLEKHKALLDATGRIAKIGGWELIVSTKEVRWTAETYRIHEVAIDSDFRLEEAIHFYHPDDRPHVEKAIKDAIDKAKEFDLELRLTTNLGRDIMVRALCTPILKEGVVVRLEGTFQDITHQKQQEEKIQVLHKRTNALLDYTPVCHKVLDLDFNLHYMNRCGFQMMKLENPDDVYGKPYPFDFFPEDSRKKVLEELERVKQTGLRSDFKCIAKDSQGNEGWFRQSIVPVKKEDGSLDYLTVVSTDITEEKKRQEERKKAEHLEAIGRLAGGVAHDFNNQLTGILGFAELLQQKIDDPELKGFAENIFREAQRTADLTQKLLAFARKDQFQVKQVDVHPLIQQVLSELNLFIEDIVYTTDLQAQHATIKGDPRSLHKALHGICLNAKEAMPDGGTLSMTTRNLPIEETPLVSERSTCRTGSVLVLSILDTGQGIPDHILPHVFEPFFTTKPFVEGAGMGLAAVFGTVKKHGGDIQVTSEEGRGTEVILYFPLTD